MTKQFVLEGDDGVKLAAWRSIPDGHPKGIVQIAHGLAEHSGRYRRLTKSLTAAGYEVYANDHRGHGASAGAHGLGDFGPGGFRSLVDDMAALTRVAQRITPGAPLALLGHSMGSFAAQLYLLEHHAELTALALSGTSAVDKLLASLMADGQPIGANLMNAPFEPARTTHDWLTRDTAEIDAFLADPLCGFTLAETATARVVELANGARDDPRLAEVRHDLPILVISGEFDPVTGPRQVFAAALIDRYRAAGLRDVQHKVYPGGRHEMFNEICRDEVEADFIAWLDGAMAGSRLSRA